MSKERVKSCDHKNRNAISKLKKSEVAVIITIAIIFITKGNAIVVKLSALVGTLAQYW